MATIRVPTMTLPPADDGAATVPAVPPADSDAGGPVRARRRLALLLVPVVLAVGVALAVAALLPDRPSVPRTQPTASAVAPASSDSPAAERSRRAPAPSPTTGSPAARSGTLVEATNRVDALIGDGLATGEIRADVAVDLRNELRNLTAAVGRGRDELTTPAARLREKVAVRLGEGTISPAYADKLDTAIAELGEAGSDPGRRSADHHPGWLADVVPTGGEALVDVLVAQRHPLDREVLRDVCHADLRVQLLAARSARGSSSGRSQTSPVSPGRTSSGTAPRPSATTGVPVAIASSITMPNGSSHWIGMIRQRASTSIRRVSWRSALNTTVTSSPSRGATTWS
ncbi:hypothetical protein GCM10027614_61650 [Micromonospora vulcania]